MGGERLIEEIRYAPNWDRRREHPDESVALALNDSSHSNYSKYIEPQ